jgi:hypothetical protein
MGTEASGKLPSSGPVHVQRRNMRLQCGGVARLNHEHYVGGGLRFGWPHRKAAACPKTR